MSAWRGGELVVVLLHLLLVMCGSAAVVAGVAAAFVSHEQTRQLLRATQYCSSTHKLNILLMQELVEQLLEGPKTENKQSTRAPNETLL